MRQRALVPLAVIILAFGAGRRDYGAAATTRPQLSSSLRQHLTAPSPGFAARGFDNKTSSFSIAFKGETSAYREMFTSVMPGAMLTIEAVDGPSGAYRFTAERGVVSARGPRSWRWEAPVTPGLYELRVEGPPDTHAIELNAFVLVPIADRQGEVLNGYRIGRYPASKGNPLYEPPAGFIEVTKENADTNVTPHFRLEQFVCKQEPTGRFPKYVVLKERLLLKLEAMLEEVNRLGFDADTLHVMSGFRTPYYNHAIGDVAYSMHQFGSAADVFVDSRNKGVMDDLTSDGRTDVNDSRYLHNVVDDMLMRPELRRFQGGMGYYPATRAHPPFLHVDVRGTRARWVG
jgi:hypothetical protein